LPTTSRTSIASRKYETGIDGEIGFDGERMNRCLHQMPALSIPYASEKKHFKSIMNDKNCEDDATGTYMDTLGGNFWKIVNRLKQK